MKIIEMKCPNCGSAITVDGDAKIGVCEYCQSQFYLDSDEQSGYDFERGRMRAQEEARRREEELERQRMLQEIADQKAWEEEEKKKSYGITFICVILDIVGIIIAVLTKGRGTLLALIPLAVVVIEPALIVIQFRKRRFIGAITTIILTVIMLVIWI